MARVLAACVARSQSTEGVEPGTPAGFHVVVTQAELDAPPSAEMPRVRCWREGGDLHVEARWDV